MFFSNNVKDHFHRYFHIALTVVMTGLIIAVLFPDDMQAQKSDHSREAFIGTWSGVLKAGGEELRAVFHIERAEDSALTASMDSPDEGATGISASRVSVDGDSLTLEFESVDGRFEGVLAAADTTIKGMWTKNGRSWPITLSPPGAQASLPSQQPEANPADVKSPEAIVTAAYESISMADGKKPDLDRLRSLFLPEARLIPTGRNNGVPVKNFFSVENYLEGANIEELSKKRFVEYEIHSVMERFGDMAHVFSTYESAVKAEGPEPIGRGINSFQLWYDGKRWWIVNLMWHEERGDLSIPDRYEK